MDKKPEPIIVTTSQMPVFENELVKELYCHDFSIPPDILFQLLALPGDSLAADLRKVLHDGIKRYKYFLENPEIGEEETCFVNHAVLLIAERNRIELLPDILHFLQAGEDILDFYMGGLLIETIWIALYKLCLEDPAPLFDFLKRPTIDTLSKTPGNQALTQLYYHNQILEPTIIAGYKDLAAYFIEHKDDENLIDTELIAEVAITMKDISLPELDEDIKLLYQHGLVALWYAGSYQSLISGMESSMLKEAIPGIVSLYQEAIDTWSGLNDNFFDEDNFDDDFFDDDFGIQQPVVRSAPKIGRNDPCPCGSGKKYKKCCLKDID